MKKQKSGKILYGDCIKVLKKLPDQSVNMCVTSPPYFGLRDYGCDGQIGLEKSPEEYIDKLVNVFRQVYRALKNDGTLWVNIGDSYSGSGKGVCADGLIHNVGAKQKTNAGSVLGKMVKMDATGCKPKDLIGIPWMLAFALRAEGYYLRQDIIWHKGNAMPSSVTDRCTTAHEYIFLLSKNRKYYYDHDAIKTDALDATLKRNKHKFNGAFKGQFKGTPNEKRWQDGRPIENPTFGADGKANKRSVWTVNVKPYKGSHFATFPPDLIKPCILAGSKPNGVVLDPFMGSGTTAAVAILNGRRYVGAELNIEYKPLIDKRIREAEVKIHNNNIPKLFSR